MKPKTLVIKLGGALLSHNEILEEIFRIIGQFRQDSDRALVIVHGGGYLVDELMQKLHFTIEKKQGLRVTPKKQIPYITGALAGTANKLLQAHALKAKVPSVGLSLADGDLCTVTQGDSELGCVGKITSTNGALISLIMDAGYLPIVSSIGIDKIAGLMNVNADHAAVSVASALDAELVFLSDVSGVLGRDRQLLPQLNQSDCEQLIASGVITDGMIVKVRAAFDAANLLGRPVGIASWRHPEALSKLLNGHNIGTLFLD